MNIDINRVNIEDSDDDCNLSEEEIEQETPDPMKFFSDDRVNQGEPDLVF
jgi:hypothetical protein